MVTLILFELHIPILIFSPVGNFEQQSLTNRSLGYLFYFLNLRISGGLTSSGTPVYKTECFQSKIFQVIEICIMGWVVLNSSLMIPDFSHNIRIRLAQLEFFLLPPDFAMSLPCWLSQFWKAKLRQPTRQRLSRVSGQQKKFQLGQSYSYIMSKVGD